MSNKPTKRALVPKLCFPEFRDAAQWSIKQLKQVCAVNPATSELPEIFAYIDLESVEAGELKVKKIISREESPSRAQRLLNYGDVIFQIVRPYQRNNFYFKIHDGIKYVASTGYAQLRAFESKDFLFQVIHTDDFVEKVIAKCTGSSYPAINSSDLAEIAVAIPKPAEQQKIADCLSSVDELITTQTQKLDMLKAHKKGLMQQLFPAEGETLPRLRFPDFREAGDWEERKAGTLFANRIEEGEDGLPIYSVTMNNGMVKRSSLNRRVDDIAESSGNKKAYKDDIAYNMMRMWQGAFGVSVEDCMVSPAYVVLAPENKVCSDFFGYLFKLPKYVLLLTSHSQGLTLDRLRLYYKYFAQISLLIPTFLEQQKITDCLSSVDELITTQTQKLDTLKAHKKGLMQQLFPSLAKE